MPSSWPPALIGASRLQRTVELVVGVDDVPQETIELVQQDRRVDRVAQRDGGVDVVVVAVGEDDPLDLAAVDGVDDRLVVVSGIEDQHLLVVADEPDVVLHLPLASAESEDPVPW